MRREGYRYLGEFDLFAAEGGKRHVWKIIKTKLAHRQSIRRTGDFVEHFGDGGGKVQVSGGFLTIKSLTGVAIEMFVTTCFELVVHLNSWTWTPITSRVVIGIRIGVYV
jgi:hypothetical protein